MEPTRMAVLERQKRFNISIRNLQDSLSSTMNDILQSISEYIANLESELEFERKMNKQRID